MCNGLTSGTCVQQKPSLSEAGTRGPRPPVSSGTPQMRIGWRLPLVFKMEAEVEDCAAVASEGSSSGGSEGDVEAGADEERKGRGAALGHADEGLGRSPPAVRKERGAWGGGGGGQDSLNHPKPARHAMDLVEKGRGVMWCSWPSGFAGGKRHAESSLTQALWVGGIGEVKTPGNVKTVTAMRSGMSQAGPPPLRGACGVPTLPTPTSGPLGPDHAHTVPTLSSAKCCQV